jgi:hypothetical protein
MAEYSLGEIAIPFIFWAIILSTIALLMASIAPISNMINKLRSAGLVNGFMGANFKRSYYISLFLGSIFLCILGLGLIVFKIWFQTNDFDTHLLFILACKFVIYLFLSPVLTSTALVLTNETYNSQPTE